MQSSDSSLIGEGAADNLVLNEEPIGSQQSLINILQLTDFSMWFHFVSNGSMSHSLMFPHFYDFFF